MRALVPEGARSRRIFTRLIFIAVLFLCLPALGQEPAALQGSFIASAGPATFRGKWSASVSSRQPNTVAGSWILLNEHNDMVLQGTWSAQKSTAGWKGTWRARVLRGRAYSGSWTASEPGPGSKTFADMLQAAVKSGAAGTWATGGHGGNWRLTPAP
ncbi:MAG TPA: hypothetical protein VGR48_20380 [Terriglobales bacterium]|nr:hypothetical protein [Terriglobales bacterium]